MSASKPYRLIYNGTNHGKTLQQAWDIARHLRQVMKTEDRNIEITVHSLELADLQRENEELRRTIRLLNGTPEPGVLYDETYPEFKKVVSTVNVDKLKETVTFQAGEPT